MSSDKSALEKALTSPDTVVRHAAIRRMHIEDEIVQLDTFLTFYASSQADPVVSDSPKLPVAPVNGIKVRSSTVQDSVEMKAPRVAKGTRLAEAVNAVLVNHGKPMQLQELFDALKITNPDICPGKIDSLRPRLHEQREKIGMIKGKGYWPAGTEVPT